MYPVRKIDAIILGLIAAFFALLLFWQGPWHAAAEDWSADFYAQLHGERSMDERFLFVFISSQDVHDLGGWPITRDYYGYFLNAVAGRGARLIAFNLLMEGPQKDYPEYDQIFSDYLETNANVCLPMAFTRFEPPRAGSSPLTIADEPAWPYTAFRRHLRGCGFSNLPLASAIYRLPLLASHQDTLRLSFGAEIARQYWGGRPFRADASTLFFFDQQDREHRISLDGKGRLRLNPCGGKRLDQLGFVEALRLLHDRPAEIDVAGRLIFVGVTAPGLSVSKATVLNPALPAPLLQLTVAENILTGSFLTPVPRLLQFLLILLLCAGLYLAARRWAWRRLALSALVLISLAPLAGLIAFFWNWLLPLLYPLAAVFTGAALMTGWRVVKMRAGALERQRSLEDEIEGQSGQLLEARAQLAALQKQVEADRSSLDQMAAAGIASRQQAIAELEIRLSDLRAAARPGQHATLRKYDILYHAGSPMADVVRMIDMLGTSDLTVIIQGETGTGKELVARAIHQAGRRARAPLLAVNCSALPETLLESELFGHEKGSFTGAIARRRGLFELADGGTLFLDEISETSPAFQAKLLRALQEKVVQRLGGESLTPVDVRVIAATNRDLEALVRAQQFRMDLYYRLNGITLALPPLRERTMDIPLLAGHFLAAQTTPRPVDLSEEALAALMAYSWPGNIRELENLLRRAVLLARGDQRECIRKSDLPEPLLKTKSSQPAYLSLEDQILHSLRALHFSHAAISRTARALGNRDRGTITEYFRGLCFAYLVAENYDIAAAARALTGSSEPGVIGRVSKKMRGYVDNLTAATNPDDPLLFKGLPRKYHPALQQLLDHLDQIE